MLKIIPVNPDGDPFELLVPSCSKSKKKRRKKHCKSNNNTKQGEVKKISTYVKFLQELLNITLILQQTTKRNLNVNTHKPENTDKSVNKLTTPLCCTGTLGLGSSASLSLSSSDPGSVSSIKRTTIEYQLSC